jgi:hypothetical protein|tara:strand:- start:374 stop:562 length:189 start_codon:yes stop_codon:yes gene_type:complete
MTGKGRHDRLLSILTMIDKRLDFTQNSDKIIDIPDKVILVLFQTVKFPAAVAAEQCNIGDIS